MKIQSVSLRDTPVKAWQSLGILKRTLWRLISILTLLLTLTALAPIDRGVHSTVEWKSSQDRKARGLELKSGSDQGFVTFLLIEGPSSQLVTLASVMNSAGGVSHHKITDGTTGWWLEMTEDYETSWPTPTVAFRSIGKGPDEKTSFRLMLRTSDGFEFETRLPRRLGGSFQDLLRILGESGKRNQLARSIPAPIREVIDFLTSALTNDNHPARRVGAGSGHLLNVCEWAFEVDQEVSGLEGEIWQFVEKSGFHHGLTPVEPEQIELVSKFPSLENTDPMRGMKPSDLFPPVDPER
jgi:hypothetical protein